MAPMFQGSVIDAETIYLGMKIQEGFEALAKAVGGSETAIQLMCAAMKDADRHHDNRSARSVNNLETKSTEMRKEIRSLKVALVAAMKEPDPVLVTPNDLAKETTTA